MRIKIELSGGLELLFGKVKRFDVDVPEDPAGGLTAGGLIAYMAGHLLKERPELFVAGDTVRPGILVLINEADWELDGTTAAALSAGDTVAFISTLHGG